MRNSSRFWLAFATSALALFLTIGVVVVVPGVAHAESTATVDDAVTAGTNKFVYTGSSWQNCGGCNGSAYQGAYHYGYTTGDKVVFTFSGTQATLYGFKEPPGGIGSFAVDGGAAVDVDFYAATQSLSAVFTTPVLVSGTHTVTLTVTGRRASGVSPTVNVDKADVSGGSGTTTTPTTPTSTTPTTTTPATPTSTTPTSTTPTSTTPTTTTTTPTNKTGMASITFDDGTIGQYNYGRPALNQHNLKATFYIVSDALSWGPTNMSATQAKQLIAEGDEIGNHTRDHSNLATLTSAQITAEFSDSQAAIQSQLGVTPTNCAYPYGSHNPTVETIAAQFFKACRGTSGGTNGSDLSPYNLVNFYVMQTTTPADIRAAVERAKAEGSWVIFTYHGVDPSGSGSEDVTPANLSAQLDQVVASGIPVKTVNAALMSLGR